MTLVPSYGGRFRVEKAFYFLMNALNAKLLLRETRTDGHETDSERDGDKDFSNVCI